MGTYELMKLLKEIADASEWVLDGNLCEGDKEAAVNTLAEIAGICLAVRILTEEK